MAEKEKEQTRGMHLSADMVEYGIEYQRQQNELMQQLVQQNAAVEPYLEALKTDIDILKTNNTELMHAIKAENQTLRGELSKEHEKLRGEVKTEISTLRGEVKTEIATLGGELNTNIATLRGELNKEHEKLRGEVNTSIKGVKVTNWIILSIVGTIFTGLAVKLIADVIK